MFENLRLTPLVVLGLLTGFTGCKNMPKDLTPLHMNANFIDKDWLVEDISGQGVIDRAQTTLHFTRDGKAFGSTGCNRFNSAYKETEAGLNFGPIMMTKRACPPSLMDQERKFTSVLSRVTHIEFDPQNRLILRTDAGQSLTATALSAPKD